MGSSSITRMINTRAEKDPVFAAWRAQGGNNPLVGLSGVKGTAQDKYMAFKEKYENTGTVGSASGTLGGGARRTTSATGGQTILAGASSSTDAETAKKKTLGG